MPTLKKMLWEPYSDSQVTVHLKSYEKGNKAKSMPLLQSEYTIIHSPMHSWYQRIILLCIRSDFSYRTCIVSPKLQRFLQMTRKTYRVIGDNTQEYQYSKLSRKA